MPQEPIARVGPGRPRYGKGPGRARATILGGGNYVPHRLSWGGGMARLPPPLDPPMDVLSLPSCIFEAGWRLIVRLYAFIYLIRSFIEWLKSEKLTYRIECQLKLWSPSHFELTFPLNLV